MRFKARNDFRGGTTSIGLPALMIASPMSSDWFGMNLIPFSCLQTISKSTALASVVRKSAGEAASERHSDGLSTCKRGAEATFVVGGRLIHLLAVSLPNV